MSTRDEVGARGYDLTTRDPNRKEAEALPQLMEIVAALMEREQEVLNVAEELEIIVRDEKSLNRIRRYILENPMHWHPDMENPNHTGEDEAWTNLFTPTSM